MLDYDKLSKKFDEISATLTTKDLEDWLHLYEARLFNEDRESNALGKQHHVWINCDELINERNIYVKAPQLACMDLEIKIEEAGNTQFALAA